MRGRRLTPVLILLLCVQTLALTTLGSDRASAQGLPEVIAVTDFTVESRCQVIAEEFADEAHTQVIDSRTYPCPPGTLLRSIPMTLGAAQAQGLPYIVLTGDHAVDQAALRQLKLSFLPGPSGSRATNNVDALARALASNPNVSVSSDSRRPGVQSRMVLAPGDVPAEAWVANTHCNQVYYGRRIQYWTYAEGAWVDVVVAYRKNLNNCGATIFITRATATLLDPPNPGEDLFWDQGYYRGGVTWTSWDMGCKQLGYGYSQVTDMWWEGEPYWYYVDESINDTSFGCDWWGEEYTGSVLLDK